MLTTTYPPDLALTFDSIPCTTPNFQILQNMVTALDPKPIDSPEPIKTKGLPDKINSLIRSDAHPFNLQGLSRQVASPRLLGPAR